MRPGFDTRFRQLLLASFALLLALVLAAPASAVPVSVNTGLIASPCDSNVLQTPNHELGLGLASLPPGPFPVADEITASDIPTGMAACLPTPSHTLITMTNLSGTAWEEVWYVSDPETLIANFDDLLINGEEAFRIDRVGLNTPLVFESMASNGVFEAGETWDFIIDDYFNALGLPASAFRSCLPGILPGDCTTGLVGGASGGDVVSSGSILVFIPEPATLPLLILGLVALAAGRRRG